jgi:hypothetical protein
MSKKYDSQTKNDSADKTSSLFKGILIAGIVPLIIGLNVFIYSGGSLSIARAVLLNSDLSHLLISSALNLINPFIIIFIAYTSESRTLFGVNLRIQSRFWIPIAIIGILFLQWMQVIGLVIFAILSFFVFAKWKKDDKRFFASISAVVLIIIMNTSMQVWNPIEKIETTKGKIYTATVLKETKDWTTLVTRDRNMVIIKNSDLEKRTVCQSENKSLISQLVPEVYNTKSIRCK